MRKEAQMSATGAPPGPSGHYTVPGLGIRKQAISKCSGNVLDMAVAMLETDIMQAFYPYGDGKTLDSANFGIFKQNWFMIRTSVPRYNGLTASDYNMGATLNGDLSLDILVLHTSQQFYGIDAWFGGHRNGQSGLSNPNTPDITNYKNAVYWIRDQLNSDPKYLTDDTRFWVQVPAI